MRASTDLSILPRKTAVFPLYFVILTQKLL